MAPWYLTNDSEGHVPTEQADSRSQLLPVNPNFAAMMRHTHAAVGASATWLLASFVPHHDPGAIAIIMVFCVNGAKVLHLDAIDWYQTFGSGVKSHQPEFWKSGAIAFAVRRDAVDNISLSGRLHLWLASHCLTIVGICQPPGGRCLQ